MRDHRGIDLDQLLTGDVPDPAADGPLLTGTSVEVARRLGVSPLAARTAFAVTTFASGLGVVLYLACWAVLVRAPAVRRQQHAGTSVAPTPPRVPAAQVAPQDPWRTLGLGILVTAVMVTAIGAGWARPSLVWPALLVGAGVVIAWAPPGEPLARDALRQTGGAVLVLSGLLVLVADRLSWSLLVDGAVTGVVVLVGIALVAGPWMLRSAQAMATERRERMRAEEREAVASHLHDSVLQTLTLIQKRAADPTADPRVVAALARRQERELRRWLYGRAEGWAPQDRLRDAIEVTVADVEDLHGVTIEAVVVGDLQLDERVAATVAAAREALVNAAKFSGRHELSLFVEAAPGVLTVFVRDRGIGFDPTQVSEDRRGIRDSIVGRMARSGGTAAIHTGPDAGVEVELVLPLPRHAEPEGVDR